jgi:3-hydroxyethyl bacteriochlorophyllide a dehydrogenase
MDTLAVVLEEPERLVLDRLELAPQGEDDLVVDIEWSGISTGTERLLYKGLMPAFPGMGYPLVPGYESVGRIVEAGKRSGSRIGTRVFVPGARCFKDVRGLFGGAAARLVVPAARATPVDEVWGADAVLLALAATARHAVAAPGAALPDLIVGHGVLGRLLARITLASGGVPPTVWENNPARRGDAADYRVIDPAADERRDYRSIYDVSGNATLLDTLVQHLAPGGEIVLAGFYAEPLSLSFPPAFMREARLRVAAEWREPDLAATLALVRSGRLALDGLITHRHAATQAACAYRTAFTDPACLKMILDWRTCP